MYQHYDTKRKRLFVDMDGVLAVFNKVDNMSELYKEGYFLKLSQQEKVITAIKIIKQEHPNLEVYTLSAYLHDSPYALTEKNAWLDTYLPEINISNRIFVPYGSDKTAYVEGGVSKNDYLLDDFTNNLVAWELDGGNGIKLLNDINNTRGTWQGNKISFNNAPRILADKLINVLRDALMIKDANPRRRDINPGSSTIKKFKEEQVMEQENRSIENQVEQVNANENNESTYERKEFIAPEKSETTENIENYLTGKMGLNKGIIYDCIKDGSIYQTSVYSEYLDKDVNNVVFAGFDEQNKMQSAITQSFQGYEQIVEGSQLKYGFMIRASESNKEAVAVSVFENPTELLAGASLAKIKDKSSYKGIHRLSLGCSVSDDKNFQSTTALKNFLDHNPQVKIVNVCVSNTDNGRKLLDKIQGLLENLEEHRGEKTKLNNLIPKDAKNFHEQLQNKVIQLKKIKNSKDER
jgi:5'(3')-deoxyribonucleotidase